VRGEALALSAGLILEEGLPMEDLRRIVASMREAAKAVGVPIVTGDTKVVDRGKGDGVFVNVTGIGLVRDGIEISPRHARPGDVVLVSGGIAVHGIAVMSVREGLKFDTELISDSAPLDTLVEEVLAAAGEKVHVLRDPTRGGVASTLNEIAAQAKVGIRLEEECIPVSEDVRGACEILGLDPLYVANEGKCLVIVAPEMADAALAALRSHPLGKDAARIGEVVADHSGKVVMRSRIGGLRVVDLLTGEQLRGSAEPPGRPVDQGTPPAGSGSGAESSSARRMNPAAASSTGSGLSACGEWPHPGRTSVEAGPRTWRTIASTWRTVPYRSSSPG